MIPVIRHLSPAWPYGEDLAQEMNRERRAHRRALAAQRALLVLWYCALCLAVGFLMGRVVGTL